MIKKKFIISYKRKNVVIAYAITEDGEFKFSITTYYDYDYRKNTSWQNVNLIIYHY